jgi:NodT family efflux transporter outer membrane factor (OMF) lipoprotein
MSEPTRGLRPTTSATTAIATAIALISTSACAVGMKYQRPDVPTPPAYRESLPQGWTDAQPRDSAPRGQWWSPFNDPGLDALEGRVSISNQNVLAAEAQFRAAQAAVRVTRADEFPTVSLSPSATIAGGARTLGTGAALAGSHQYSIPLDATYQADVWGSIRRSVKANAAVAQASAADLENARLLYESEIASDYFQLQGLDAEQRVLGSAVQSYERSLELTRDRFQGGVASMGDVALAETQLETARGQLTDLGIARAQFEHAIAVLTGRAPSEVSIPESDVGSTPPTVTVGLPSTLLERRPDIAAAERRVAAANEQIGVARAAFYPALTFGGTAGSQAVAIADLLTTPTRLWSVGVQLAETLFDGGKRRAQVRLTQAEYDTAVATYKQTVLTGFQQVDDALVELDRLAQEAEIASRAVAAAQQSVDIANIQYTGGLVNYLQVVTAQTSLLQNQRSAIDILTRRLVASVSLIQSLGGGWDASQLPSSAEVRR